MHDALVVLGDALNPDGTLSQFGRDRVAPAPSCCDRRPRAGWSCPARARSRAGPELPIEAWRCASSPCRWARRPTGSSEEESDLHVQNAYFTKVRILEPRGWTRLLLVTSACTWSGRS
jgi:hypothetical protein